MEIIQGTVDNIYTRTVTTKYGEKPAYSLKVNDQFYSAGFKKPPFAEGSEVKFVAVQNGQYYNVDGAIEVVTAAAPVQQGNTLNDVHTGTAKPAKQAVDWEAKDRRISYFSCRNSAIDLVSAAVANGLVTIPAKEKDKLGFFTDLVNKQADEFFIASWVNEDYPTADPQDSFGDLADDIGEE